MNYYKKSILYANILRLIIYLFAITVFFLYPFLISKYWNGYPYFISKYFNGNSFLYVAKGLTLPYLIGNKLLGYTMSIWIKKEIKNAPNPRRMYWNYRLCNPNFTDNYPVIPDFNINEYPIVPEKIKIFDKKNKPIIFFKDNEITFVNTIGKFITYNYSEINQFNISSKLKFLFLFGNYYWFEILHKNNDSSFNRIYLNGINMNIDEFEWIVEHFKKKINKTN